jgi:hypothetical protein
MISEGRYLCVWLEILKGDKQKNVGDEVVGWEEGAIRGTLVSGKPS